MQFRDRLGLASRELRAKHVAEQVVVAVPLALTIQWHEEEVLPFDGLERASRSRPAHHGVAERPVEAIEDRRSCEEALSLARQTPEYLRAHVVDDEAIVAVESDGRQGGSALFLQRQRRQIQTDGPSLGGVCELHGLGFRRSDTGSPQQSLRLGRAEHEVVDADLDQPPVGAEPRESDVRDGSRRERHHRALRDVPGDRRDRIHDQGLDQPVEVVQDEHERPGPRGERGAEAREDPSLRGAG